MIYLLYLESSLYLTAMSALSDSQSQIDTKLSLGSDSFQTDPSLLSAISDKTEESWSMEHGGSLNITNDNDWVISRQSGGGPLIASREEMKVFSVKIPPTSCCLCRGTPQMGLGVKRAVTKPGRGDNHRVKAQQILTFC